MTTVEIDLTEEQRQQVLDVLIRRFRRLSDPALLELEQLTRHPADLAGFQAKTRDLAITKQQLVRAKDTNSANVIDAAFSRPVSRRQFLTCSGYGVLGALLGITGYGWWQSDISAGTLSATMSDIEGNIVSLADSVREIQSIIGVCRQAILEFQSAYPQTTFGFTQLRANVETARGLYSQLEGTGMSVAEIIEFLLNLSSFNADVARFAQPISTMLDLVKNTPALVAVIDHVLENLSIWFSDDNDRGINRKLLFPIQLIFDAIDDDIGTKLESLQAQVSAS